MRGNIVAVRVDVIVTAANPQLSGGGGVDGAVHHAAGPDLLAELRFRHQRCAIGAAVLTGPGRLAELDVRHVVHAVGPIWRGGTRGEMELLRSAYLSALRIADEVGAKSVALPAISCGAYGYPLAEGARAAIAAVREALASAGSIDRAVFVLSSGESYAAFRRALEADGPPEG
jgi:O-acetyl-ADP-ribose deacetylase (regulator of RNase III)